MVAPRRAHKRQAVHVGVATNNVITGIGYRCQKGTEILTFFRGGTSSSTGSSTGQPTSTSAAQSTQSALSQLTDASSCTDWNSAHSHTQNAYLTANEASIPTLAALVSNLGEQPALKFAHGFITTECGQLATAEPSLTVGDLLTTLGTPSNTPSGSCTTRPGFRPGENLPTCPGY